MTGIRNFALREGSEGTIRGASGASIPEEAALERSGSLSHGQVATRKVISADAGAQQHGVCVPLSVVSDGLCSNQGWHMMQSIFKAIAHVQVPFFRTSNSAFQVHEGCCVDMGISVSILWHCSCSMMHVCARPLCLGNLAYWQHHVILWNSQRAILFASPDMIHACTCF